MGRYNRNYHAEQFEAAAADYAEANGWDFHVDRFGVQFHNKDAPYTEQDYWDYYEEGQEESVRY